MVGEDGNKFDVVDFIMAYEGGEFDEDEVIDGFQHLLDSGIVWQLQGSYQRVAINMIRAGYISEKTRGPNDKR